MIRRQETAKADAPTGRIVHLRSNAAFVEPAAGGAPQRLPRSDNAWLVSLSPAGDAALFFVAPPNTPWGEAALTRGFVSRLPFRDARPLPAPLDRIFTPELVWTPDGGSAFVTADKVRGAYLVAENRFRQTRAGDFPAQSASRGGEVVAWTTDADVWVGWPQTGRRRTLFSAGKPAPLQDALQRARRPENLRAVAGVAPSLWRDASNWQIGKPALTPDGKTLFFAANLGQGMGAAGNTSFAYFAADVATGRLSALSSLGTFFGRIPWETAVLPGGERLWFRFSEHGSAIENPSALIVVDLPTQRKRELLRGDPAHKNDTNLTDGVAASPDGRFVAVAVQYYDVAKVLQQERWEPAAQDFEVRIFDAAAGKQVRRIAGARGPSWSRTA